MTIKGPSTGPGPWVRAHCFRWIRWPCRDHFKHFLVAALDNVCTRLLCINETRTQLFLGWTAHSYVLKAITAKVLRVCVTVRGRSAPIDFFKSNPLIGRVSMSTKLYFIFKPWLARSSKPQAICFAAEYYFFFYFRELFSQTEHHRSMQS